MTATLRSGSMTVLGDVAVVFDDGSRIRWARTGGNRWTLSEHWPNAEEGAAIERHRARGGCLLVVSDGRPITADAFASEVPLGAGASQGADVVELSVDHFDWLPELVRARGTAFLQEQADRWNGVPALLRPAVVLDTAIEEPFTPGQITFALLAPGISRSRIERELVDYLAFVRGGGAAAGRRSA